MPGKKTVKDTEIDVQDTPPNGTPERVSGEVESLFAIFARDYGGGMIPGPANTIIAEINSSLPWRSTIA